MLSLANNFYLLTHYTKGTVKQNALLVFSIKFQNFFKYINTLLTIPSRYYLLSTSKILAKSKDTLRIQLFKKKNNLLKS